MLSESNFGSVFDYSSAFDYVPSKDMKTSYRGNNYKSVFAYHAVSLDSDEDSSFISKETWPSALFRKVVTISLYLVALVSFPLSIWMCIKKVHALERIVLMRLGKIQPIRGPGFAFILPCVDKWTRVDLRPRHFSILTPQLLTADKGIVEVNTDVEFRVANVVNYVLKLDRQEDTLYDLSLFCLSNLISGKDQEDIELKQELINASLKDELNINAVKWGLEIIKVTIKSVKVLKAAEPVDAVGTIVTALKAATGSSDEAISFLPFIPPSSQSISKPCNKVHDEDNTQTLISVVADQQDYVLVMKNIVEKSIQHENAFPNYKATIRFDVEGPPKRIIYFILDKGNISVTENYDHSIASDVQLTLSEDYLWRILQGQKSYLDAYMEGQVRVSGDWMLLQSLSKVLQF